MRLWDWGVRKERGGIGAGVSDARQSYQHPRGVTPHDCNRNDNRPPNLHPPPLSPCLECTRDSNNTSPHLHPISPTTLTVSRLRRRSTLVPAAPAAPPPSPPTKSFPLALLRTLVSRLSGRSPAASTTSGVIFAKAARGALLARGGLDPAAPASAPAPATSTPAAPAPAPAALPGGARAPAGLAADGLRDSAWCSSAIAASTSPPLFWFRLTTLRDPVDDPPLLDPETEALVARGVVPESDPWVARMASPPSAGASALQRPARGAEGDWDCGGGEEGSGGWVGGDGVWGKERASGGGEGWRVGVAAQGWSGREGGTSRYRTPRLLSQQHAHSCLTSFGAALKKLFMMSP